MTRGLKDLRVGRSSRSAAGPAIVAGIALALLLWFGPEPARATGGEAGSAAELYVLHCASCHQPAGEGLAGTFPPLAGNPAAADAAYVEAVIRDGLSGPIEVLGVDYDQVMPPVVALTDDGEIQEVVGYVVDLAAAGGGGTGDGSTDSEPDPEAGDEVAGPIVGDVDRGHDLFLGSTRFDNGGAACAACHTAGSVGNLGGQGLGPDLTDTFQTLGGEAGLTGWLANPPSPTMQPLFADRPMTEAEVADVIAFLGDAPSQNQPSSSYDRFLVAGLGGLVSLIAGMTLAWRGMRQTYVQRLQARPGGRSRSRRGSGTRTGAGGRPRRGSASAPQPERSEQPAQAGGSSR